MALKPCKTCKKEVAHNAKTCPHCGVKDPGTTGKDVIMGLCIIAAVVAVIAVACTGDKDSSIQTSNNTSSRAVQQEPVTEAKTLGMTLDEFRTAYNAVVADPKSRMPALKVQEGTVNNVATFTIWNVYVNATINKQTGHVQGLLMGMGKGSPEDSLRGLVVLAAAAQAASPSEKKEDVAKVIGQLIQNASLQLDDEKLPSKEVQLKSRSFSGSASQMLGLMISVTPI